MKKGEINKVVVNDSFCVVVPNVAFAWGTKYHLKDSEFMLYAHLQFMRQGSQWNQTYTSVEMIIKYLGLRTKNKQRDKEGVIKNLKSLVEKGYITISFDNDDVGDIKKEFFAIKQVQEIFSEKNVVEFEDNGKNRIFKGYTKLSGEHYNLAENEGRALMTIAYINWRSKIKYDVPKSEWVKVLSISKSTLEDSMNNYKDRFLKVIPGEYFSDLNGEVRQKTNKHLILDSKNTQTESNDFNNKDRNKIYLEKMWSKVNDMRVKSNNNVFLQIFDKNTFIRIDGFKVWKETTCDFVKRNGQKKIDAIKQSNKNFSDKVISNLEKKYDEMVKNEKKITEMITFTSSNEEEYENYEEYSSSYVKKDRTAENEILKYLDPVPSNSISSKRLNFFEES